MADLLPIWHHFQIADLNDAIGDNVGTRSLKIEKDDGAFKLEFHIVCINMTGVKRRRMITPTEYKKRITSVEPHQADMLPNTRNSLNMLRMRMSHFRIRTVPSESASATSRGLHPLHSLQAR